MGPRHKFLAMPADVLAFAWSAPMRELAARTGMSDTGLKKLLTGQGVVLPPRGHWNRVHAGKAVVAPPPPRPRRPGEGGRVIFDARFRGHVAEAGPVPEGGPFASAEVPGDLAVLREQELAKIGKATVPRDLVRPHPALARLLRQEEARRVKAAASSWHWDQPRLDTPVAQRQLRLLSGLYLALARRGHGGQTWEDREEIKAECEIGEQQLHLQFEVVGKHRVEARGGFSRPARDLPASTPLALMLARGLGADITTRWEDQAGCPLEKQLAQIAADLVVAGEASFRQGLVEAREQAERWQRWEEERRLQRLAELNRQRLEHLEQSGALLRQAEELRVLVARVGAAVESGRLALGAGELAAWHAWALARADELDPVVSGQVLLHLRPPSD